MWILDNIYCLGNNSQNIQKPETPQNNADLQKDNSEEDNNTKKGIRTEEFVPIELPINKTGSTKKGKNQVESNDSNELQTSRATIDNADEAGDDYYQDYSEEDQYYNEEGMTKKELILLKQKLGRHLDKTTKKNEKTM